MGLTNIEYHNLYTRNILNNDNLLDMLNNIEFTEEDDKLLFKSVLDMDNDPLRYKLLHIEKDIILLYLIQFNIATTKPNLPFKSLRHFKSLLLTVLIYTLS